MTRIVLVLALLVGCSKKEKKAEPPPPTLASGTAAAPAEPDAATPPAAKAEVLPAKLGDKDGIVIAEKQGGEVTATVKGQSVTIADGTRVEIVEGGKEPMVGSQDDATVMVKYEGKEIELKADRVITEGSLIRSPDGKHAVFTAVTACGDLCHSVIYLVSTDGRRTKLGEGGPDTTAAWTADKVAVGNHGLWVATLASHEAKNVEGYTSPAFGPDGVLYVRDPSGSAFTLDGDKPKQVWKAKKKKKSADEEDMPEEDPEPVTFVDGKPKFD